MIRLLGRSPHFSETLYGDLMDYIYDESSHGWFPVNSISAVSSGTLALIEKVHKKIVNVKDLLACKTEIELALVLQHSIPENIWYQILQPHIPTPVTIESSLGCLTDKQIFKAETQTAEWIFDKIIAEILNPVDGNDECIVCAAPLGSVFMAPSCASNYQLCLNCPKEVEKKFGNKCLYRHQNITYIMRYHGEK
jgi:hypothetical protein